MRKVVKQVIIHGSVAVLSIGIGYVIAQATEGFWRVVFPGVGGRVYHIDGAGWPFESLKKTELASGVIVERLTNGFWANVGVWTIVALYCLETAAVGLYGLYKWHKDEKRRKRDLIG